MNHVQKNTLLNLIHREERGFYLESTWELGVMLFFLKRRKSIVVSCGILEMGFYGWNPILLPRKQEEGTKTFTCTDKSVDPRSSTRRISGALLHLLAPLFVFFSPFRSGPSEKSRARERESKKRLEKACLLLLKILFFFPSVDFFVLVRSSMTATKEPNPLAHINLFRK